MPHSEVCTRKIEELGIDGWCVGANCTITREDAPALFELLVHGLKMKDL